MLALDSGLAFDPARDADFFSLLPPHQAVCLVELRDAKAEPLLIRTQDLRRRMQRLLGPPDPTSKRLNLRELACGVRYRVTASKLEQTFAYYQNAKQIFPARYRDLLRLRPPAILKVSLRNAYPRCYVTRHISVDAAGAPSAGTYYGPFSSRRSAQAFSERVLDLFKVRRCQIKIRRDPAFPGCIYSEMKMCLAPCFAGCTKEEYDTEVNRLVQFLDTNGASLQTAFEQERARASEDLDFERAAAVHKRIEKLDDVLRARPELARRIQDVNAVILQRAAEDQTIAAFAIHAGRFRDPFFIRFAEIAGQPRSAEQLFREQLEPPTASQPLDADLSEHLWLAARWYYSNPREGEIFFREKDWPYRKILRACSRILNPKTEQPGAAGPPGPRDSHKGAA